MTNQLTTLENQIIYLLHCALNEKTPRIEVLGEVDYARLELVAKEHKIGSMLSVPIEKLAKANPELEISLNEWIDFRNRAIRVNLLMDIEREKLFSFMEEKGIWYMPLKGIILKELYPKSFMREMGDNDILFDETKAELVRAYMIEQGFEVNKYEITNHDVYKKEPFFYFEMHRKLIDITASHRQRYEYYLDIKDKLVLNNYKHFEYRFTEEDFYIYLISHSQKHFYRYGTGLRTLTDIYVFLEKYNSILNFEYIENELGKLQLDDFEIMVRALAIKILSFDEISELSEAESSALHYFMNSGAYGKYENYIRNNMSKTSKITYTLGRLFLVDEEILMGRYPFYYKHKYLLPVLWVKRVVNVVINGRERLIFELKYLAKNLKK